MSEVAIKNANILLLDLSKGMTKDPHIEYCLVNDIKPISEYARNYDANSDQITDPILLDSVNLDKTTLLTCCRQLISDEIYRQLNGKNCPLCRQNISIKYLRFHYQNKSYVVGYNNADTVIELKKRIVQTIREDGDKYLEFKILKYPKIKLYRKNYDQENIIERHFCQGFCHNELLLPESNKLSQFKLVSGSTIKLISDVL